MNVIVALGETATRAARRGAPDTALVFLLGRPVGNGLSEQSEPARRQYDRRFGECVEAEKWPELAKQAAT